MDNATILYYFVVLLTSSLATFWAIRAIIKKDLISSLDTDEFRKEKLRRHEKKVTAFARIILGFFIAISSYFVVIPCVCDLPRVIMGKYEVELCTAQESYEYRRDLWANFITENGDEISLMVLDQDYEAGQQYLIYYLPWSRFGTLYEM